MHRKSLASLVALAAISVPLFASAAGLGGPFGGQITVTQPCNNGLLLTVKEPFGVTQLMWNYGELPFLMHVVPHPGQYILGMSGGIAVCTLGPLVYGKGSIILFHGDSL